MAIFCAICGKKQSGFILDFPLSTELNDLRICAPCNERKERMIKNAGVNNEIYLKEREYFEEILKQQKLSSEVNKYFEEIFSTCNQAFEDSKRREAERLKQIAIQEEQERIYNYLLNNFLMTTGFNFENCKIIRYNKVICAETVLGTGLVSENSAYWADIFGTESNKFNNKLEQARESATQKLIAKAIDLKANAIIGLDFDYTVFSDNLIAVIANGTAVTVDKPDYDVNC